MKQEIRKRFLEFRREGTFQSLYAAQSYLTNNGYSYGSLCGNAPVGIMKGDWNIAKWKNLTAQERKEVHGTITGEFREGPVVITFFDGFTPID